MNSRIWQRSSPLVGFVVLALGWALGVELSGTKLIPGPLQVGEALVVLASEGLLLRYVVASLFRVTWGYLTAILLAIPLGLLVGSARRSEAFVNPLVQIVRPISPLAWIPLAILWFGVGDLAAVYVIFVASFFPMFVAAANSVKNVPAVHVQAAQNFGLSSSETVLRVVLPAVLPQLLVGMRITLGIAWLVVVAAEMIAVNSGLGFLIIDARNAGDRYDLVMAGMVVIGVIGLLLDLGMRRLESLKMLRWGYATDASPNTTNHVERRRRAR